MAKPTNAIKGFIEVITASGSLLLAIRNINSVKRDGDQCLITLNTPIDQYNSKNVLAAQTYDSLLALIREAS